MKVTIITVTFNSGYFLEQCIQSVIAQNYPNIEYIIVDGGSTDNTLDIINRYQSFISKWISEKDGGMYDAINKGIQMATGDVIGTLNSDDLFASSDVIDAIVNTFDRYGVAAVYGDIVYVHPINTGKVVRQWNGGDYNRTNINFGWMPAHPSFYINKAVLQNGGNYDSKFTSSADYEFMTRYLYYHKISAQYLPKLIVKMRTGGMSNQSLYKRLLANRKDYQAMKKNNIPLAWLVAIFKPLRKIPQFKYQITAPLRYF